MNPILWYVMKNVKPFDWELTHLEIHEMKVSVFGEYLTSKAMYIDDIPFHIEFYPRGYKMDDKVCIYVYCRPEDVGISEIDACCIVSINEIGFKYIFHCKTFSVDDNNVRIDEGGFEPNELANLTNINITVKIKIYKIIYSDGCSLPTKLPRKQKNSDTINDNTILTQLENELDIIKSRMINTDFPKAPQDRMKNKYNVNSITKFQPPQAKASYVAYTDYIQIVTEMKNAFTESTNSANEVFKQTNNGITGELLQETKENNIQINNNENSMIGDNEIDILKGQINSIETFNREEMDKIKKNMENKLKQKDIQVHALSKHIAMLKKDNILKNKTLKAKDNEINILKNKQSLLEQSNAIIEEKWNQSNKQQKILQNECVALQTQLHSNTTDMQEQFGVLLKQINKLTNELSIFKTNFDIMKFSTNTNICYDVYDILKPLNLTKYYNLFIDNGFETFNELNDLCIQDLKDMGINKVAHHKKILNAIKKRNNNNEQKNDDLKMDSPSVEGGNTEIHF